MDPQKQSPIFSKTYDFLLWVLRHTEQYPKSQRFRLAKRLEDSAFELYDNLVIAAGSASPQVALQTADLVLSRLKLSVRLSRDLQLMTPKQYEYAARKLAEIGRLLGGWQKAKFEPNRNTDGIPGDAARRLVEQ